MPRGDKKVSSSPLTLRTLRIPEMFARQKKQLEMERAKRRDDSASLGRAVVDVIDLVSDSEEEANGGDRPKLATSTNGPISHNRLPTTSSPISHNRLPTTSSPISHNHSHTMISPMPHDNTASPGRKLSLSLKRRLLNDVKVEKDSPERPRTENVSLGSKYPPTHQTTPLKVIRAEKVETARRRCSNGEEDGPPRPKRLAYVESEDATSTSGAPGDLSTVRECALASFLRRDGRLPRCIETELWPQEECVSTTTPDLPGPVETRVLAPGIMDVIRPDDFIPHYLNNFVHVVKAVLTEPDERSLFDTEDRSTLKRFFLLSAGAAKLYVRMFQRKFTWHRVIKLDYKEIGADLTPHILELSSAGLFASEAELDDFTTVLNLLPGNTLRSLCKKTLGIADSTMTKPKLIQHALLLCRQQTSLAPDGCLTELVLQRAKKLLGGCCKMKPEPRKVFNRILTLHFMTDLAEDEEDTSTGRPSPLTKVMLVNIGRLSYPPYIPHRLHTIFCDREDLLRYETALELENEIHFALESKDWQVADELCTEAIEAMQHLKEDPFIQSHEDSLPEFLRAFTAGSVYTRCLSLRVETLQKMRRYEPAVEQLRELLGQTHYNRDRRGHWFDRLALNHDQHLHQPVQALSVISEALHDPSVRTGHRLALYDRAKRICRKIPKLRKLFVELPVVECDPLSEVFIAGRRVPCAIPGYKTAFLSQGTADGISEHVGICSVEELAIQHYRSQGYPEGLHGEGSTLVTIYGLLFWDIIYQSSIPDAFRTPHQSAPLDLCTDDFYESRRVEIDATLEDISRASSEDLADRIAEVWKSHEKQSSLVSWDRFGRVERVQSLVRCIEGHSLAAICGRLAKDYRHCRGGVPDLALWNPGERKWKMVEVKGPNDHLSHKQMMWLHFLKSVGVDVEVCHVREVGARNLKKTTGPDEAFLSLVNGQEIPPNNL